MAFGCVDVWVREIRPYTVPQRHERARHWRLAQVLHDQADIVKDLDALDSVVRTRQDPLVGLVDAERPAMHELGFELVGISLEHEELLDVRVGGTEPRRGWVEPCEPKHHLLGNGRGEDGGHRGVDVVEDLLAGAV